MYGFEIFLVHLLRKFDFSGTFFSTFLYLARFYLSPLTWQRWQTLDLIYFINISGRRGGQETDFKTLAWSFVSPFFSAVIEYLLLVLDKREHKVYKYWIFRLYPTHTAWDISASLTLHNKVLLWVYSSSQSLQFKNGYLLSAINFPCWLLNIG